MTKKLRGKKTQWKHRSTLERNRKEIVKIKKEKSYISKKSLLNFRLHYIWAFNFKRAQYVFKAVKNQNLFGYPERFWQKINICAKVLIPFAQNIIAVNFMYELKINLLTFGRHLESNLFSTQCKE